MASHIDPRNGVPRWMHPVLGGLSVDFSSYFIEKLRNLGHDDWHVFWNERRLSD